METRIHIFDNKTKKNVATVFHLKSKIVLFKSKFISSKYNEITFGFGRIFYTPQLYLKRTQKNDYIF